MSEHIEFERLYRFVFDEKSTDNFDEDIAINTHLLKCKECFEIYQNLTKLRDSIDALNHLTDLQAEKEAEKAFAKMVEERNKEFDKQQKKEKIKSKIFAAIEKMRDIPEDIADEIEEFKCFVMEKAEGIALEVKDFTSIVCDGQGMGMQFGYLKPAYGVVAKSADAEKQEIDYVTSKMVDGNNSVSVDEGTNSIKIVLESDAVPGSIICLVPEDGEAVVKVLDDNCFDENGELLEIVFSDIKPGNYDIVWQSDIN